MHPQNSEPSTRICLQVRGLGHCIAFKNRKRSILDRNTGLQRTLTDPEAKKWMERCKKLFTQQLLSAYRTEGGAIRTESSQRFWTALFNPSRKFDDSCKIIPSIDIRCIRVPEGEEGADLVIELL